jgi:hypothetical protein
VHIDSGVDHTTPSRVMVCDDVLLNVAGRWIGIFVWCVNVNKYTWKRLAISVP